MSHHPHQMTDATAIRTFVYGGNATFTLVSKKTQTRFTFRVRCPEGETAPHFVSVMTGPDNNASYSYMGMIVKEKETKRIFCRPTEKSKVEEEAPSFIAINWLLDQLGKGQLSQLCEFWHSGKCGCCGRKLTKPASIETGIGPECAKKE